jgi:hypothetical protein
MTMRNGRRHPSGEVARRPRRGVRLRRQIIEGRPVFEQRMRALGAVVLDGRDPTSVLATRIVQEVGRRFPADR